MYFIPDKLPISGLDWQALAPLIGRANAKLSNYNGILHNMVNPKILLLELYDFVKEKIPSITHSYHSTAICDALFESPFITTTKLLNEVKINNKATCNNILSKLVDADILKVHKKGAGQRPTTYVFANLLNIVEGNNNF